MISVKSTGSFARTIAFLKAVEKIPEAISRALHEAGEAGVTALANATPVRTGLTASRWDYKIGVKKGVYSVVWTNDDIEGGFPVAIMIQYGYGTGTGGYVQGQDYINPALKPIFDRITDKVWKAVTSA